MDKIVENRELSSMLADPSLLRDQAYIAGEWVNSKNKETFEVRNTASLEVICKVPDLGLAETRQAIDAAYDAQKLWSSKTGKERSSILKTFYELMMANAEDLAKIITAEMGKPISEATGEIAYGASFIEFFAEESKKDYELEVGLTREFEKDLVKKTKDQALIDTALDDIAVQQNLAQGIVDRSRSRYGIATTGAFNLEQRRAIDRGRVNIASDALNNARISQDEQNTALLNELSNISNTINKQITQMGSSAALQTTNMENSYKAAKSQHKSNKYGIIGSFIGAL